MAKILKYFLYAITGIPAAVASGLLIKYWDNMLYTLGKIEIIGHFWPGFLLSVLVYIVICLVVSITVRYAMKENRHIRRIQAAITVLFTLQAENSITAGDDDCEDIADTVELQLRRNGMTDSEVKKAMNDFFPKTRNNTKNTN